MKERPRTHKATRVNDRRVGGQRTDLERQLANQPIDHDHFWDRVADRVEQQRKERLA